MAATDTTGAEPAHSLDSLLDLAAEQSASDLLLQEGEPPRFRVGGRMVQGQSGVLRRGQVLDLLRDRVPDAAARRFEEAGSADFALERDRERWRVALYQQRGGTGASLRRIPLHVPSLEDWGLPHALHAVADLSEGLVLVTGPAGTGKSSTIAALVRDLLERRPLHVVTIEDPIEYILPGGQGVVTQREVGVDVPDFNEGLRAALRQQPDAIVVGEIRDRETAETALNAAETGSLVLSTLHTRSAAETISRLLEMFPDDERKRVLGHLSRVLQCVFSQLLVERSDREAELIAAVEVLRSSPPVQQRILSGDIGGLLEEIESSVSYYGMQSMNQSLAALVLLGVVDKAEALRRSPSSDDLDLLIRSAELVPMEGDPMAKRYSDYSQVFQLQELKDAHEQELQRHREAEAKLREQVQKLEGSVQSLEQQLAQSRRERSSITEEIEEYRSDLDVARQKFEISVGRLQRQASRLRERTVGRRPWWKRLLGGGD